MPDWPTLSVGYSQGHGSGTIYGTDQETNSSTSLFNVRSGYQIAGFRLNAFFDRNTTDSKFPEFLVGQSESLQDSTGHDIGFGAQHALPIHGSFYLNFDRASSESNYFSTAGQTSNTSNYTDDMLTSGANFHPTQKFAFNVAESYTSNLNGYVAQSLGNGVGSTPGVDFGSGAHSFTVGGGASYQFTNFLNGSAQATRYDQFYFGNSYTGTFISGTLSYGKRLLDMFSFSGAVVDSYNGQGSNAVGFIGNINYSHRIKGWQTSGTFSYAQNVQSLLVTYTTSSYQYSANVHRRLASGWQWTAAFNGSHSGLTNYQGTTNHSEGYSTSLSSRKFTLTGNYGQSSGLSLFGAGTLQGVPPTPGINDYVIFAGSTYGGGFSVQPLRRLILSGAYSRGISNTLAQTDSHNDMQIYNAQLQYHLRRISLQAGYTRFTQGISAVGAPANTTTYFVGFSRWFDFF